MDYEKVTYNQYLYYLCMGGVNEIIVLQAYTDPLDIPYTDNSGGWYTT